MDQERAKIEAAIKFIGLVLLFIAVYLTLSKVESYLRYKAIDDCGKISKYVTVDGKNTISYPIADVYNSCLEDKNLKK